MPAAGAGEYVPVDEQDGSTLPEESFMIDRVVTKLLSGRLRSGGARRRGPASDAPSTGAEDLWPGAHDYRAFVGPPSDYDLIAGLQFTLLFCAGMREADKVLDVGCGSLRGGRLLIPYLRPGHYFAIEPNRWLVEEGLSHELGMDMVNIKRPTFAFVNDFSAESFGVRFDWVMAHSIFSHTYPDMASVGLAKIGHSLAPSGVLLATYVEGRSTSGSGWLYPACVNYSWEQMVRLLSAAQLTAHRLDWPHPRQVWFAAGRSDAQAKVDELADCLHGLPLGNG